MPRDEKAAPMPAGDLKTQGGEKLWLRQLQAATGTRIDVRARVADRRPPQEQLALDFRCTKTLKPYRVLLEEDRQSGKLAVRRVVTEQFEQDTWENEGALPTKREVLIEDVADSGLRDCPHCAGKGIVQCHCGGLSCRGEAPESGGRFRHKCPWCGSEGYPVGGLESVEAAHTRIPRGTALSKKSVDGELGRCRQ